MKILNAGDSGEAQSKKKGLRALLGIGIVAGAIAVSSTLAANININSGPVEFGQGVAQTVSCSGDTSVIVTPTSSFANTNAVVIPFDFQVSGSTTDLLNINAESLTVGMEVNGTNIETGTVITEITSRGVGEIYDVVTISPALNLEALPTGNLTFGNNGSFNLSSITVSEIPEACTNKVFTIKIYDNTSSTPLTISDFAGGDTSAMVWWANGYGDGDRPSTNPNEAVLNFPADNNVSGDWSSNAYNSGYGIETNNYTPLSPNGFKINLPKSVDASRVYKITVETQDDSSSLNIDGDGTSYYDWWLLQL